ncbi:MAG: protein-L-isoaspartate O-methyltransferase, partial [Rhodospirillales bacterium]
PNRVTDIAVIEAMAAVPREQFLPKARQGIAYVDEDIDLGDGRYMLEPMVFARLLQAAEIRPTDAVLDVACASGYSSAVIGRFATAVVGLESNSDFAAMASKTMIDMNADNAVIVEGALAEGYARQAPFDVIFINGSIEVEPEKLLAQLGEGGRMVAVMKGAKSSAARIWTNHAGTISVRTLFDAGVPLLKEFAKVPEFVF